MRALWPFGGLGLALLGAVVLPVVLDDPHARQGSLTDDEFVVAASIARREADMAVGQGGTITSAHATASDVAPEGSNTGKPCTSGRFLQITLVGDFPYTSTTVGVVGADVDADDLDVHALVLTADAETEDVCWISVQIGKIAAPPPGAAVLFTD